MAKGIIAELLQPSCFTGNQTLQKLYHTSFDHKHIIERAMIIAFYPAVPVVFWYFVNLVAV
jgi:hypothetical protein